MYAEFNGINLGYNILVAKQNHQKYQSKIKDLVAKNLPKKNTLKLIILKRDIRALLRLSVQN